jgi:hypothetical protein
MKDMVHHCETTTTDMQCDVGTFDQYDQMMKALAGYGLAGKITMQDGTRSGKVLAKVDYCKVEPASGVRRARRRGNRQLTAVRARARGGGGVSGAAERAQGRRGHGEPRGAHGHRHGVRP